MLLHSLKIRIRLKQCQVIWEAIGKVTNSYSLIIEYTIVEVF